MKTQLLIGITMVGLAGCFNGGGSGGESDPDPTPMMNELTAIASQQANDEPKEIDDVIMLKTDINSLFNGVEPVEVQQGDSPLDIINKLGGGI